MDARQLPYRLVYTGQHSETFNELEKAFGTRDADEVLVPNFEAATKKRFAAWLIGFSTQAAKRMIGGSWRGTKLGVVHGDTASTLLGALVIRLIGARVCHVEAGLRSEKLLDPFPEEIIRRLTSILSSIHFAPDRASVDNLSRTKGQVIETSGNTLRDSLSLALASIGTLPTKGGSGGYAVISIHRNENLSSTSDFDFLMNLVLRVSDVLPVKFVLHPATREKIMATGWLDQLQRKPSLELMDRMDYMEFVSLLIHSNMLLTDGGSNQEEAAMLGLPTLLLRRTTERGDGLGDNIVLSNLEHGITDTFVRMNAYASWDLREPSDTSPSKLIVDTLQATVFGCRGDTHSKPSK
ncbi:UDP-N-acetylglucosamine 2-epimerase [Pseudoxanthomonas suwonensis]|nr:UDP-N-acetylglucosamine 2-epimerase [Pseudoxanthomonas suwonensis]